MNSRLFAVCTLAALVVLHSLAPARAQVARGEPLVVGSRQVLELSTQRSPSLRAAILAEKRAEAATYAAEGLYPFTLGADGGYTHSSVPLGSSSYYGRDTFLLGVDVSKVFALGTAAQLRLEGQWSDSELQDAASVNGVAPQSSTWGSTARLTLTQPLLRGLGPRVVLSPLRQAKREEEVVSKSTRRSAGELARAVLTTYWDLWLASRAVEINVRSRDVATQQLQEAEERVKAGGAAPVDKLDYQTRVATLNETVIESEAESRRAGIRLASRAGVVEEYAVLQPDTEEPLPEVQGIRNVDELLTRALLRSPAIEESFAAVLSAEEKLSVAGETMRQRLDLVGWIEAGTAARDPLSPLITDYGRSEAYGGYIGLVYELPLDDRKKEGERAQARLSLDIAKAQLESVKNQIRADLAVAHDDLITAKNRLEMAEETLTLAKAQQEAQQERYRLGAAIFTAVRDAEENVRQAELRLTRARVDIVKADIELRYLTGELLEKIASVFE